MKSSAFTLLACAALCATQAFCQERGTVDLSSRDWSITLDRKAKWQNDELYLPPVDLTKLPVNLPTGGWQLLDSPDKTGVNLPATVEEHLWGWNGQTFGVTGNYTGVSWFETKVDVPAEWSGRRIVMNVGSVRFRAEIFVNHQLAGYDLVNSTPFTVDVTPYIEPGKTNDIAFRITDPNGNFNWKDSQVYTWGDYRTNPSHGFGGITGKVSLQATDKLYVQNVFVKNTLHPRTVELEITAANETGVAQTAKDLRIEIRDHATGNVVYQKSMKWNDLQPGENKRNLSITVPKAKLWDVDNPNLYDLQLTLDNDRLTERFGFRWFEVKDIKGDRQFFLNGKRMVLRTAISWSFWPYNGITPSDSLAKKQILAAKSLGLNMLNFHRTIGQPNVLDYADELGLLYFEEPGGNQYPIQHFNDNDKQSRFYFGYRNEKVARMVKRDRNHPSLVIYNLHNERGADPQAEDYRQMRMTHQLDPTRILTYNSCNGNNPLNEPNAHFKLHLMPNDTTFYDYGWYDRHHAGGPGCYHDNLYLGKDNYPRYSNHKDEIIYWGEDGAIGTPPRLQLIREELLKSGKPNNWEADDYLKWYDVYDRYLKENGFSTAFPTVDHLTRAMGNVAFYYQGRMIENVRISNTVDAYAINGWESMKLENHSGMVDNFRNTKGDQEVLAYYNQPLYLAVKMNRKVMQVGDTTYVDTYIVNEKNLKGSFTLQLKAVDEQGRTIATHKERVNVKGGNDYGQCLQTRWAFAPQSKGYTRIEASLLRGNAEAAKGEDKLFAVQLSTEGISANGMVADTTGTLNHFLRGAGLQLPAYKGGTPQGDYLLVGAYEPTQFGSGINDILEWVYKGHTLIVVDNPERWAELLADKEVLDYRGSKVLGKSWYGGNFFNREHRLFDGLPSNVVFNWEYQCFATYNRRRIGLRCFNGETIVGCVSDHKKEVYSALQVIPAGSGKVIITTLDIPACIHDTKGFSSPVDLDGINESMNTFNTKGKNSSNAVGQQLLLNMLREANR